ncbi:MAG: response regulator [Candidatus Sericytochromatia bacterium]|nr:response regulator [Candidatus Sericytochromatia bacterium]
MPANTDSDSAVPTGASANVPEPAAGRDGSEPHPDGRLAFPTVGIGASAGGLEAIIALLKGLPEDPGMAFVIVQHLDAQRRSLLGEILAQATSMPVVTATDGLLVACDHVYVIPENTSMMVQGGTLQLNPRKLTHGKHMPVDVFFQSLAADQGNQAIGVVLSGGDGDGTIGLQTIKAEAGTAIVQEPDTAKNPSMPDTAIATGVADLILPPAKIGAALITIGQRLKIQMARPLLITSDAAPLPDALQEVFKRLKASCGIDFATYKPNTVERRLARRMVVQGADTVEQYVRCLDEHPEEVDALYAELLIHVTSFFRDPEVFEVLKKTVFPKIIEGLADGQSIRIWVPGCATGEEVYSLAIGLLECLGDDVAQMPVQIFATDVGVAALAEARAGIYPESIAAQVSPARLKRFFVPVAGGYRVTQFVRDLCLFVQHDVTNDPPFSRLDLISCRNLLIYFGRDLQDWVVPTFHYALSPNGYLQLGRSEGLEGFADLFLPVDTTTKVFARRVTGSRNRTRVTFGGFDSARLTPHAVGPTRQPARGLSALKQAADRALLANLAPAGVVVNDAMDVLETYGSTGPYLELSPGTANLNLLRMVRVGLLADVRTALHQAKKQNTPVHRVGLAAEGDASPRPVRIDVIPVTLPPPAVEHYFLILFRESPAVPDVSTRESRLPEVEGDSNESFKQLRLELLASREHLSAVIEQHAIINDELISGNEDALSANEEFQSMNEELETAKEELQSTNEELNTVNDELQFRNHDLNDLNDDLTNLISSVDIAVVMLDLDRRIRRMSPKAEIVLNVGPADLGRRIGDFKPIFSEPGLDRLTSDFLSDGVPRDVEVQDDQGNWFRLQVHPYRRHDQIIAGAVLSLIDINDLKQSANAAARAGDYAAAIVDTVQVAMVVLDAQLQVKSANQAFYALFQVDAAATQGRYIYETGGGHWDTPRLRELLETIVQNQKEVNDCEVAHDFPHLGRKTLSLSARQIGPHDNQPITIILAINDMTERATLLANEQAARHEAENANRAKDDFLATLSHELRSPLTTILGWTHLLQKGRLSPEKVVLGIGAIDRSARTQCRLIDDLLDVSRIVEGKVHLDHKPVCITAIVSTAVDSLRLTANAKSITIEMVSDPAVGIVECDGDRINQVIVNLLTNAVKFTPSGGSVSVALDICDGQARLRIVDTGIGISPAFMPHLFERFKQGDEAMTRRQGGLGIGLAIVRHLVALHGGTITAASPGHNQGSTFTVLLPLVQSAGSPTVAPLPALDVAEEEASALAGQRLLIVDDDRDALTVLGEILRHHGAAVVTANSAEEALVCITASQPTLLISDLAMPDVDGYTLIRQIRALAEGEGRDTPAIALTASAHAASAPAALSAGFSAHATKPVDVAAIVALIGKLTAVAARP